MMENSKTKIKVGITHGDINGINYEILLKTFIKKGILELFTPIIYGSSKALEFWSQHTKYEDLSSWKYIDALENIEPDFVNLISCCKEEEVSVEIGKATPLAGALAFQSLEMAIQDLKDKKIDVLLTAPINKSVMPDTFPYNGHTDYLGYKFNLPEDRNPLMILTCDDIRVALVTTHISIQDIVKNITSKKIVDKLKDLNLSLQKDFNIEKPKIAVLGLNPHCGDNGLMGNEENSIIKPAIKEAWEENGILSFGPFPSDGFWGSAELHKYDAILAMYHDQGLTPFKALFMDRGVNFSAGISIVRTSPDHGTGFAIAGKNVASEISFCEAIYLAIDIYRKRQQYENARKNPLPTLYNIKGHDS